MGVFDKFSGIGVASGFKLQAKAPIDPRQVVDTIDDRDALITENGAYEGMQVYVKADKKTYLLKDLAAGTWEELGSGGVASELLTIEISVSITETTADVLKTYLNNNADVLAELEAASSFILKVNRQNIAVPDTYVFEQNYKDITTGAQHYFICVHAYGKTTTESTILWFSVESGVVKDVTFKSNDLSSGGGTSVQPDYNQNDSTASDYIKNRPFYNTSTIETILDQTFSTIEALGLIFWSTNTSVIQFVKGDTLKVVYNGTEYTEEVKDMDGVLCVGNTSLGGVPSTTDEPFLVMNVYFPGGSPGTTIITSTAQTNATIKITKEIENVKTIDPKYIKDMYYENIVETELHNGTLTNAQSASGEYYTATLSPFFRLGEDNDKLSVMINNVEKILTVVSHASWEEAGSLTADEIKIMNRDDAVKIDTNAQYTNATIIVTNIHSDVHSIPQKYVNSEEYQIEISVTSFSDEDIELALKNYLNDNPPELSAIRSRTSWVLKAVATSGGNKLSIDYRWTTHSAYSVALLQGQDTLTFTSFSRNSIDATDSTFKTKQTTMAIIVSNRTVQSIELTSTLLLDNSSWEFGVVDNMNADRDPSNGTLALYSETSSGNYNTFNGIVTLHSWITKAQQRSDFQIPTPTKPTDLVDKQYADSLASPTYNHNISITDGSSYSLRFTYPSKSSAIITTQAQLATLIGSKELTASGWALVDGVYYTIGFIKNNSYCCYGNAKAPTWNELGSYTITDSLL